MTSHTSRLLGATALCLLLAAPTALAQSNNSAEDTKELDTVTVNGRYLYTDRVNALKSPTPIIDVPQSLSIVTADDIIQQGFDSISDIVLYTPGVTQSQGEGHRDSVVFRGVRSTADFFIDGARDDVQYFRSLYNLEQVEVLRGPNALFFGRGGTGGVLNRVTKKGMIGENFLGYLGGVDTFGGGTVQLDGNYTVSDRAAIRVNAYYERLNNHRDFFDGDRFGINPTAFLQLTDRTSLNLSYEYVNNERFVDRGIPSGADGRPAEQLADITFSDAELATTTFEAHILRASLSHEFLDNLKGNLSLSFADNDKLYANFFPVSFDEDTNIVGLDGYIDTTQRQNFVISANLIGEFQTGRFGHTIVTGGEFIDTSNDNDRFNAVFDQTNDDVEFFLADRPINLNGGTGVNASGDVTTVTFSDLNDDTEADVTVFSAYIQDEIEVAPWLDLILGVRYDSFDITVDNIETFIDTDARDITSRRDDRFSPRLGFVLKPIENISLYGSFSESFLPRSGEQFADLPDDPATPGNDTLDPNEFSNLELGLKYDFANRLSFTAAIFEIEQSSPQEAAPIRDPATGIIIDANAGTLEVVDSEIRGIELQVQGQITDKWDISAGYSYLEGDQVASQDVVNPATGQVVIAQGEENGLILRELPEHTFNIWSNYQLTPKFGIGAGLTFQDESFADNGNNVTLPSFVRIDAAAYYNLTDKIRLQVNIENLTDTEYFPNAHTANNITVGAPINARFTISGRF